MAKSTPPHAFTPSAKPSDAGTATPEDDDLLRRARGHIADEFGGTMPAGIEVEIEDKRIRLRGCVADLATAERVAKAAAIEPGILGVYNELQARDDNEPSGGIAGAEAAGAIDAADAAASGERGATLPPVPGPIHHKV